MPERVYLHVGLFKTGTTYLQEALWSNRQSLADQGVLLPGDHRRFQRFAVWDLLGRRLRGVQQGCVPGRWHELVDAANGWSGSQVLVSEEYLTLARPAHVRRVVRSFEPAEVHVVVTVRDLGRTLTSAWQQQISTGRSWTWPEFLAAVREPETGPPSAGVAFWLRHDLTRLLRSWETALPPERIHVVVVPARGAPATLLLERFAAATRLDPARLAPPPQPANRSVGSAEAELLRRLNAGLGGRLNERQYLFVMTRVLKPTLLARKGGSPIALPAAERGWVLQRSEQLVEFLRAGGYDVVGDLEELRPAPSGDGETPHEAPDRELVEAAVQALTATVEDYAAHWWRGRRRARVSGVARRERLASAGRALGYRARFTALSGGDHHPVLARAARLYLRASARRSSSST
jgi:hypothetical protein